MEPETSEAKDPHRWPVQAGAFAEGAPLKERRAAFGARMRAVREAKNMTAPALAQMTRIILVYIEALESGHFEKLPGEVFGKGFVRCIAKNLGADSGPLSAEFDSLWEKTAPRSVLKVEIRNKPVKVRSDFVQSSLVNVRSLIRRGAMVKVALPIAAGALLVYALMATPLLKTLARHVHGTSAAVIPAKHLDLAPAPEETSAPPPAAVQAEEPKPQAAVQTNTPAPAPVEAAPATTTVEKAEPPAAPPAKAAEAATADKQQVLEIVVTDPVRLKLEVDRGAPVTKELTPDTYKFTFTDHAEMMVYDAAAVKISYNGRPLGVLGAKGRVRRLSFQAQTPEAKKL